MDPPDRKEEIILWTKCLNGDREAWDILVYNYSEPVCITIRYKLKVSSYRFTIDCREVYQEVLELILKKLNQWRRKASLKTYIRKIASNVTMDHIRKITREDSRRITLSDTPEEENGQDISETVIDPVNYEDKIMSKIMLEELPKHFTPNERYFFELHYREDRPLEEIAKHLHKDIGAIYTMHSRIRSKLKRIKKHYLD